MDSEYPEDPNVDVLPNVMPKSDEDFFMREYLFILNLRFCWFTIPISESKLGNPFLWCPAYKHLETTKHGHQLSPEVVEYYLLQEWYQRIKGRQDEALACKVHYLDSATLKNIQEGTICDPIQTLLILQVDEPISKLPVLFLHIVSGTGPCLILFNYFKQEVFVFRSYPRSIGPSETNMYGSWDDWEGDDLWKTISNALGWTIDQADPKIIEPNWSHVGLFSHL